MQNFAIFCRSLDIKIVGPSVKVYASFVVIYTPEVPRGSLVSFSSIGKLLSLEIDIPKVVFECCALVVLEMVLPFTSTVLLYLILLVLLI